MLRAEPTAERSLREETIDTDLVVVGGGVAGVCAAISAAREGIRVCLVQDRPVLGGNTSSEVRLWMVGATSHMGNNNRWAREGGVLNEILVENTYRNPEGNPVLFDTVMLEKVVAEPTLRLLLNTAVYEVEKGTGEAIHGVRAFCSQNSIKYRLNAPLFCDASGDGVVAFLAGAPYRIGAESRLEYGELLAPSESTQELLGHSIYFYTRDSGEPVRYVAPEYALKDITKIPRYRRFNTKEQGVDLWWIEYGGSRDTVHETEEIKWELWRIIYGVWDYIKNSGNFPDAETLTLDWVGLIPGKRESRRFEGDYTLVQQDVVEQRKHYDAVSYGGWAIDHHPVDNIYSEHDPCTQWHSKGVYQIPFRTMYSRTVPNLFLAGRLISASHIAFGSSRVMATCGHNGQSVGVAAALCREQGIMPRDLAMPGRIESLQRRLLTRGQCIPGVPRKDPADLAQTARLTASSCLKDLDLPPTGQRRLTSARALIVPLTAGRIPPIRARVRCATETDLVTELRICSRPGSFTPDTTIDRITTRVRPSPDESPVGSRIDNPHERGSQEASELGSHVALPNGNGKPALPAGDGTTAGGVAVAVGAKTRVKIQRDATALATDTEVEICFNARLPQDAYAFVCLLANPDIVVAESDHVITGVTSVTHGQNKKVAKGAEQLPEEATGIDALEFWTPKRRPEARNLAIGCKLPAGLFDASNVANGHQRPTIGPNAWVASLADPEPTLTLAWDEPQLIGQVDIVLDPDWDHPMENIVMRHQEHVMPTTARRVTLIGPGDQVLYECDHNHATELNIKLSPAVRTSSLRLVIEHPSKTTPASVFEVRCYAPESGDGAAPF